MSRVGTSQRATSILFSGQTTKLRIATEVSLTIRYIERSIYEILNCVMYLHQLALAPSANTRKIYIYNNNNTTITIIKIITISATSNYHKPITVVLIMLTILVIG